MLSTGYRSAAIIALVAALVAVGHFIPGLDNSRVEDGVRNGLHLVVFAVFALIVFENLKQFGLIKAFSGAILSVAIIGVGSETLQYLSGKQPDMFDVVRDLCGAVLALGARLAWFRSTAGKPFVPLRSMWRSMSVLCIAAMVAPLMFWCSIIGLGRLASPTILDFSQWWHRYTYRAINSEITAPIDESGSASVVLLEWRRSGVVVSPMMTDWSDFSYLTIAAAMSAGPATNVTVRINDGSRKNKWDDTFMRHITIGPEHSVVRIPLSELKSEVGYPSMDLSDIQELVIFARDRRSDTAMRIDRIGLE